MASAIIHLAIAKELENKLDIKDKKDYYLGSIAPDISKLIDEPRYISHFTNDPLTAIPDLKSFENKYPNYKNNSFDLGYYIHLYTDKLWYDGFIDNLYYNNSLKLLDGTIVNMERDEILHLIYNDFTNINTQIIDKYNLDLSLFYEDFKIPDTKIDEISIDRLNVLIDKMGIIIENSKEEKSYIFDINSVLEFIDNTIKEIDKKINTRN